MGAEEALQRLSRVGADRLQYRAALADDDGLLAVSLHEERGVDADQALEAAGLAARARRALALVERVDDHRGRVRDLLPGVAEHLLADELRGQPELLLSAGRLLIDARR